MKNANSDAGAKRKKAAIAALLTHKRLMH